MQIIRRYLENTIFTWNQEESRIEPKGLLDRDANSIKVLINLAGIYGTIFPTRIVVKQDKMARPLSSYQV